MTIIVEATAQAAVKTVLESITTPTVLFASGSVVINKYSLVDGPLEVLPLAIIRTADNLRATRPTAARNDFLDLVISLYARFGMGDTGWEDSLNAYQAMRQRVVDKLFEGGNSSLSISGLMTREIRTEGGVDFKFNAQLSEAQLATAMPIMLTQNLIVALESI